MKSMGNVKEIEEAVVKLSEPDFAAFRAWFAEFEAQRQGQMRKMLAESVKGKYAWVKTSSDEFLRRKREETEIDDDQ